MKKAELVEELHALGVDINPSWTVPELRSVLMEQKEAHQSPHLPGLGTMKLEDLKTKAVELGIKMPDKPTRGWLMRMIRDQPGEEVPDGELVSFGKYKGYKFEEVPEEYLKWCLKEEERTPHMSADLKRLCQWARHKLGIEETEHYTTKTKMKMPVNNARHSSSSSAHASSDASWMPVPDSVEEPQGMSFTISEEAKEEILQLEQALALAKQKHRLPPDRSIIGEGTPESTGRGGASSSSAAKPINKRSAA